MDKSDAIWIIIWSRGPSIFSKIPFRGEILNILICRQYFYEFPFGGDIFEYSLMAELLKKNPIKRRYL